MPKQEQEYNYFLVVEDYPPYEEAVRIHAEGEGLAVVEAIARLGILAASAPEDPGMDGYTAMRTIRDLAEHRQSDYSQSEFEILYNGKELSDLRVPGSASRLTNHSFAESIAQEVRKGVRSPQSVLDQMDLQLQDEKLIGQMDNSWFNALGQRLVPPNRRHKVHSRNASVENLALEGVKRNDKDHFISPEAKEAVFGAVPKRAMVRLNRVVSFNSLDYSGVDPRRAFSEGRLMEHKTFGHLKNRHFTPVVTELAWNHPVVLLQKGKK